VAFLKAGGYDERYPAWGSDDRSFHIAMDALYRPYRRWPGSVFHLWHPRVEQRDSGAALTLAYLDAYGDAAALRRLREGHLVR
jgi:predicted glycosyltransferase involved in capsule biosynthesis